jgi:CO/xanthine dehydrogenase FAD-binding subunit
MAQSGRRVPDFAALHPGYGRRFTMKPAPFDYVRAISAAHACELIADHEDARFIAGGQTLIPMLAMRLARPARLIDISRIPELSGIEARDDAVVIGAATRQAAAEHSSVIADRVPLLAAALPFVGHAATRSRGTIGGSVVHADPAAEIPLVALTLRAKLVVRDMDGEQALPIADFFLGPMQTALPERACLTALRFPAPARGRLGVAFLEVSARPGDFALVAAAAQVVLDDGGRCVSAEIGIGGACDVPLRLDQVSADLVGSMLDDQLIAGLASEATSRLDTMADLHASAPYRRRVAATLVCRALAAARDQALARETNARHARH